MNLNFFKNRKIFKKTSIWLNIELYWKLAVGFMLVSAMMAVGFGYRLFTETNDESLSSSDISSQHVKTISKERIGKVLEYFSNREKKSNDILYSPSPIIDPSL